MSFELNPFNHLSKEWDDLKNRITELEKELGLLVIQTIASGPQTSAPTPGPDAQPSGTAVQAPAPQFPPAPQTPQAPAPQVPGPQSVPTFDQLLERGMQVSEAKGDKTCIDLIAKYGGKDEQGTIKISLVPQEKYAALFADFGAQLGLH